MFSFSISPATTVAGGSLSRRRSCTAQLVYGETLSKNHHNLYQIPNHVKLVVPENIAGDMKLHANFFLVHYQ